MENKHDVNFFVIIKGGASKFIAFVEKVFDGKENTQVRTPDKDGTLIHAEVRVGDSTILVADSKQDWPFTPAFPQVYVTNAQEILDKATQMGAEVITEVSDFYGMKIARFKDSWGNIWWLFERRTTGDEKPSTPAVADLSWQDKKPSQVYTTLMEAMKDLGTGQSKR